MGDRSAHQHVIFAIHEALDATYVAGLHSNDLLGMEISIYLSCIDQHWLIIIRWTWSHEPCWLTCLMVPTMHTDAMSNMPRTGSTRHISCPYIPIHV